MIASSKTSMLGHDLPSIKPFNNPQLCKWFFDSAIMTTCGSMFTTLCTLIVIHTDCPQSRLEAIGFPLFCYSRCAYLLSLILIEPVRGCSLEYSPACYPVGLATCQYILWCLFWAFFLLGTCHFVSAALFLLPGDGCPALFSCLELPLCCTWVNPPDPLVWKWWKTRLCPLGIFFFASARHVSVFLLNLFHINARIMSMLMTAARSPWEPSSGEPLGLLQIDCENRGCLGRCLLLAIPCPISVFQGLASGSGDAPQPFSYIWAASGLASTFSRCQMSQAIRQLLMHCNHCLQGWPLLATLPPFPLLSSERRL